MAMPGAVGVGVSILAVRVLAALAFLICHERIRIEGFSSRIEDPFSDIIAPAR
jgi:hypothetical protein